MFNELWLLAMVVRIKIPIIHDYDEILETNMIGCFSTACFMNFLSSVPLQPLHCNLVSQVSQSFKGSSFIWPLTLLFMALKKVVLTHLPGRPGGTDPPSSCQRSAVARPRPRPGGIDLWKVVLAAAGGS